MRVLFLDDDQRRHEVVKPLLVGHNCVMVETAQEAIEALAGDRFDLALLDHDLGGKHYVDSEDPTTGYRVAEFISIMPPNHRPSLVVVHSFNEPGGKRMVHVLKDAGVNAEYVPFGSRVFAIANGKGE